MHLTNYAINRNAHTGASSGHVWRRGLSWCDGSQSGTRHGGRWGVLDTDRPQCGFLCLSNSVAPNMRPQPALCVCMCMFYTGVCWEGRGGASWHALVCMHALCDCGVCASNCVCGCVVCASRVLAWTGSSFGRANHGTQAHCPQCAPDRWHGKLDALNLRGQLRGLDHRAHQPGLALSECTRVRAEGGGRGAEGSCKWRWWEQGFPLHFIHTQRVPCSNRLLLTTLNTLTNTHETGKPWLAPLHAAARAVCCSLSQLLAPTRPCQGSLPLAHHSHHPCMHAATEAQDTLPASALHHRGSASRAAHLCFPCAPHALPSSSLYCIVPASSDSRTGPWV